MFLFERFKDTKRITIFDVDDTLIVTKSIIRVSNSKTGYTAELTPQEFNTFKTRPGDNMDFSDFRNLEILKAGKIIEWVFNILKRTLAKGDPVGIITARADSNLIIDFLAHNGIKINPSYVYAVNDPALGFKGTVAQKKLAAFKKFYEMGFTDFSFYDDDEENIKIAKKFANETYNVTMNARLIRKQWIPRFSDF